MQAQHSTRHQLKIIVNDLAANIDEAKMRKMATHHFEHLISEHKCSNIINLEYSLLFIKLSIINWYETFFSVSLQMNLTI